MLNSDDITQNNKRTNIDKMLPSSWVKVLIGALLGMSILFFIYIGRYQQTVDQHTELLTIQANEISKIKEEIKNLPSITTSLNGIENRLTRMENKLDYLIK